MSAAPGSWRDRAYVVIMRVLAASVEHGCSPATTIAAVDAAYPFGPRCNHPYAAWLRARRELCSHLPGVKALVAPAPVVAAPAAIVAVDDRQGALWTEEVSS